MHGELPTRAQLDAFDRSLKAARVLPDAALDIIRATRTAHPMEVLRTALSGLGASDEEVDDHSAEATLRKGIRLTSQAPAIVAAHHRIRNGHAPVHPSEDLGHAANFLHMLKGEPPSDNAARLMDMDFVLQCRARLERLIVRGPRRRRHGRQPACRGDRRDRGAVRTRPRRGRRKRHEDGAGNR